MRFSDIVRGLNVSIFYYEARIVASLWVARLLERAGLPKRAHRMSGGFEERQHRFQNQVFALPLQDVADAGQPRVGGPRLLVAAGQCDANVRAGLSSG
jgi:hypothetical protein